MDPSQLLREARRHAGFSQRHLAAVAGVALRTVVDVEADRRRVSAAVLDVLLAACGLDLTLCVRADGEVSEELREHLRTATTERLHRHCGGDGIDLDAGPTLWQQVIALASCAWVRLEGAAAAGVWVPGLPALERATVAVRRSRRREPLPETPALEVVWLPEQRSGAWYSGVQIAAPRGGYVVVPPPAELLLDPRCDEHAVALRAAARCLHQGAGRDDGARRAPPHRDPDERQEAQNLGRSLTYAMDSRRLPVATDSRAWRTDAPVSLRQWHEEKGHPPRRGSRRRE